MRRDRTEVWRILLVWASSVLLASAMAAGQVTLGRITVYSDTDVTRFCSGSANSRYILFPGTERWALLQDGGQYSPMPVSEVVEALAQITYPGVAVDVDIVILPVPRRDVLESSAEGTVIFLSPGLAEYPREHVHYTVAHEMGHVVQHMLMPDSREDLWKRYAELRGLDWAQARAAVDHASRLHEIFAEDFRVLFGSDMARCGAGVENHDISDPRDVAGLREFFLSLIDQPPADGRLSAFPNPSSGPVVVEVMNGGQGLRIDEVTVFDVQGRVVRTLRASTDSPERFVWDGRDLAGVRVAPGVYLMAIRAGSGLQLDKITRLP